MTTATGKKIAATAPPPDSPPTHPVWSLVKAERPDMLALFHVGDHYYLFSSDASEAAVTLGLKTKSRPGEMHWLGWPHADLERLLKALLAAGKKIALCDRAEDGKKKGRVTHLTECKLTDPPPPPPKKAAAPPRVRHAEKLPDEQTRIDAVTAHPGSVTAWGHYVAFLDPHIEAATRKANAFSVMLLMEQAPNPWRLRAFRAYQNPDFARNLLTASKAGWLTDKVLIARASEAERESARKTIEAKSAADAEGFARSLKKGPWPVQDILNLAGVEGTVACTVQEKGLLFCDVNRPGADGIDITLVAQVKPAGLKPIPVRADYRRWVFLWKRLGRRPGEMFGADLRYHEDGEGGKLFWCLADSTHAAACLKLMESRPRHADDGWFLGWSKLVDPTTKYRS